MIQGHTLKWSCKAIATVGIFVLFSGISVASAEAPSSKESLSISFIEGTLRKKKKDGSWIVLKVRDQIKAGDQIQTLEKSTALLEGKKDGLKLKLKESSSLTYSGKNSFEEVLAPSQESDSHEKEDSDKDENPDTQKTQEKPKKVKTESLDFDLQEGGVFVSLDQIEPTDKKKDTEETSESLGKKLKSARKTKLRVRTKSAVMGVRGTRFFASFGKTTRADQQNDLWMCVNEGEVEVYSTSRPEEVQKVEEGYGVLIRAGEVSPPKEYEWTKHLNWNMDANDKENLQDQTDLQKSAYPDPIEVDYD